MSNGSQTDMSAEPVQPVTQSEVQPEIQIQGRQFYYQTKIHRDYKNSIDWNRNLEVARQIFISGDAPENGVYLLHVAEGDSSYYVSLGEDIENLKKQYPHLFSFIQETQNEKYDNSSEIHDWGVDGLKMDWKRANDLYKKLIGEK